MKPVICEFHTILEFENVAYIIQADRLNTNSDGFNLPRGKITVYILKDRVVTYQMRPKKGDGFFRATAITRQEAVNNLKIIELEKKLKKQFEYE